METVTEGDLLRALQEARQEATEAGEGGALTSAELAEALGWHRNRVHRELARLKAAGQLDVTKVHREAIDGSSRMSPAYRLVLAGETRCGAQDGAPAAQGAGTSYSEAGSSEGDG